MVPRFLFHRQLNVNSHSPHLRHLTQRLLTNKMCIRISETIRVTFKVNTSISKPLNKMMFMNFLIQNLLRFGRVVTPLVILNPIIRIALNRIQLIIMITPGMIPIPILLIRLPYRVKIQNLKIFPRRGTTFIIGRSHTTSRVTLVFFRGGASLGIPTASKRDIRGQQNEY